MDIRTLEIYCLIQIPTASNWHTSGYKKLLGIGKKIDSRHLWWHKSRELNLGILTLELNWEPHYYKSSGGER